jgi:hypothetical protein
MSTVIKLTLQPEVCGISGVSASKGGKGRTPTPRLIPMQLKHRRIDASLLVTAMALLLGACDARFTADLATDAPADPSITGVEASLLGLEFRRDDDTRRTLEFRDGELVDLLDLQAGDPLRLFTDEELPVGKYTGVRLLFDDDLDDNVVRTSSGEFALALADGDFAAVDFSVEDEDRSREALTLVLDLRQSLSLDEATDQYTLRPRLRTVSTDDAAQIEGAVTAVCPVGTTLNTTGGIYLFTGPDVQPDDLDGADPEPFATTRVVGSGVTGFQYALRFLPAGDYTLALTCRGNEDVLGADNDLDFRNVTAVELDARDVLQRNLN